MHAGARGSGGARLILTVRVTSRTKATGTYRAAGERAGGTVIGRQGLSLTVRVTARPVTRVTACYKCPVTAEVGRGEKFPYINQ